MNARPALLALVGTPLALALVACGGDGDETASDATSPVAGTSSTTSDPAAPAAPEAPQTATSSETSEAPPAPATGDDTGLLAAARTGLDAVAGSTVFTVDRERDGWEVTVVAADGTESDLSVTADGTSITRGPVEDRDDADDTDDLAERQRLLQDATVGLSAALATARAEVPGLPVDSVDLDLDAGLATWEVSFGEDTADEQSVTIDAVTGEVVRVELDD